MLMRIWGTAMSQSYAHFWRFYSWGHVLQYGLDRVSLSLLRAILYRDRTGNIMILHKLQAVPYRAPMILGYFTLIRIDWAVLYRASVVSGYSLPVCIDRAMPYRAALLLRAILHSCVLRARSCELGVLCDLKLTLAILA